MQDEVGVFSDVFLSCPLSIKLVLSISMTRKKPAPTQLKTTTRGLWVFDFGLRVKFSNLEWRIAIWRDVFKFGVEFWNSEWRFQIRSEVFEFGVIFSNWK